MLSLHVPIVDMRCARQVLDLFHNTEFGVPLIISTNDNGKNMQCDWSNFHYRQRL